MRSEPLAVLAVCVGLLPWATGCGPSRPAVAPVSGRITLDGRPVATGVIYFYPSTGRAAAGRINPDGTYSLGTFAADDGALLGDHRVVIEAREITEPRASAPSVRELPEDVPELMKRELGVTTVSGGPVQVTWLVPEEYAAVATTPLRATVNAGRNVIDFAIPAGSTAGSP